MMGPFQIILLVLAILLIVSDGLNIFFDSKYWTWWGTCFSYSAELFMFIASIMIILAVLRNGSYFMYRNTAILLYIADSCCVASIIIFRYVGLNCYYSFLVYNCDYGPFNWAALVSSLLITPLIIMIHIHMRSNSPSSIVVPLTQPVIYQPVISPY